jgi:putative CocE/NonD family hydrolase
MQVQEQFPRAIRVTENLWIPMPEGHRLAAKVWLPVDAEAHPVPAVVEYIPYRKRDVMAARDALMHPFFAGHGYAAIRLDIRGSGDSEGILSDEYLASEQDDMVAAIAWLAEQPWCSGAVGMIGLSWGGFNSLQVAARAPEALKAIVTVCSTDDRYNDDVHYMGGCALTGNAGWGSHFFNIMGRPPDPMIVGTDWRRIWLERLEAAHDPLVTWIGHQTRDAFWRHGSVCEDYSAIKCPVYAVGGWVDGYSNAILRLMQHLDGPRKALIGPWTHWFPHEGVPGEPIGFLQECVRWWDQWLKGTETGIMAEPMLRLWQAEDFRADAKMPSVDGHWIAETAWPPVVAGETLTLHLNPSRLDTEPGPAQTLSWLSPQSCGLGAGEWCPLDGGGDAPEFQSDQREDDGKSLCFDTLPLDQDVTLLGAPVLTAELAIDRPAGFVVVRLCDVAPDGLSSRITYALHNLAHDENHATVTAVTPGKTRRVTIRLNDLSYRLKPGHRLRLALSTSYWPMVWPAAEPVALSLVSGTATLTLPMRASKPEDAGLADFAPATSAPPLAVKVLRPGQSSRIVERDCASGRITATYANDGGLTYLDHADVAIGSTSTDYYEIDEADPATARLRMEKTARWERPGWNIRIAVVEDMTADKHAFHIFSRIEAFENDVSVFSREWTTAVPRNGV